MKKLILCMLFSVLAYAQPEHYGEIIIDLINYGASWNVTFNAEAASARWDDIFLLTEDYSEGSATASNPYITRIYFNLIGTTNPGTIPDLAIGLYKISAIESGQVKAFFYYDMRTDEIYDQSPDVYFKYDYTNKRFRNAANTQTIDGTNQTVWNLAPGIGLETSGFEDYWENCLSAIISETGNHPRLIWGPLPYTPVGNLTEFRVYRSGGHVPGQPPGTFYLYDTVDDQVYSYVDNNLTLGSDYNAYSYYIKGYIIDQWKQTFETDPSNTVEVRVAPPSKMIAGEVNPSFKYFLNQNFPNPFNPTTRISYILARDEFVTLGIYNMLGEEIVVLVSELKLAGEYYYEFDASGLSSGIYLYKIQTSSFTAVKKMSLLK